MQKKNLFIIAILLLNGLSIYGQGCEAGARVAQQVWDRTGSWDNAITLNPFKQLYYLNSSAWNSIVGNSSATIGPRHLDLDEDVSGTVQGGTTRTFVTNPLFYDNAEIRLDKTGNRGRTVITICTHEDDGKTRTVENYVFQSGNLAMPMGFSLTDVRGKIVSITINCTESMRSFSYDVKITNADPTVRTGRRQTGNFRGGN